MFSSTNLNASYMRSDIFRLDKYGKMIPYVDAHHCIHPEKGTSGQIL